MEMSQQNFQLSGIINLQGSVDADSAPQLKERLETMLQNKEKWLLLDMSKISFMDSSGLGALVACAKKFDASGGELSLVGLNQNMRKLLQITRTDRVLRVHESVEAALREKMGGVAGAGGGGGDASSEEGAGAQPQTAAAASRGGEPGSGTRIPDSWITRRENCITNGTGRTRRRYFDGSRSRSLPRKNRPRRPGAPF